MGEAQFVQSQTSQACQETIEQCAQTLDQGTRVQTPGGVFEVQWSNEGKATAMGQLAFFAEFLQTSGLFEHWLQSCPLRYSSPNAPKVVDVLGTWMLGILNGQDRYAHVGALRGDTVAREVLGMSKIIGDDSLRRALGAIAPAPKAAHNTQERATQQAQALQAEQWMQAQLRHSIANATQSGWILDCDTTVKVLYGHQEGAVVSYNPQKPGRPSHTIHTYWIGNLRLVLDAQLQAGNRHSPSHGRDGLKALLQGLPQDQRPKLVRGDSAYGSESEMLQLQELKQPYLFKLRQTAGVKQLIKRQWRRPDWSDMGQGWTGCEDELRLSGWSTKRRVIVMRRQRRTDLVLEQKSKTQKDQIELLLIDENEPVKSWDYAVLVSNAQYTLEQIGQLYRDRADCENGFDEIKNQWGWGGYSTQDIERCALSARAVALIYNWWSWYVRLANPKSRLEAKTSRPKLLSAVGKLTSHARVHKIVLVLTHEACSQIKTMIANIHAGVQHIRNAAPQLTGHHRWYALARYIADKILAFVPNTPTPVPVATG
jgi:hypothetical protein